jgi:hypothetical protein
MSIFDVILVKARGIQNVNVQRMPGEILLIPIQITPVHSCYFC